MLSTVNGMGMSRSWFPRIATEAFLESTRDGEIQRAPDPVTMIDGDLTWFNNAEEPQMLIVQIIRAPRSIVSQSPNTVLIHDAWSWDIGESPTADFPSVFQDSVGGKMQMDRPSAAAADLAYCRFFLDTDRSQRWDHPGLIDPGETIHFRYIASVQTPGIWTTATEFEPRWEASCRWTRLLLFASPVGSL
jgi:hypothetical protein